MCIRSASQVINNQQQQSKNEHNRPKTNNGHGNPNQKSQQFNYQNHRTNYSQRVHHRDNNNQWNKGYNFLHQGQINQWNWQQNKTKSRDKEVNDYGDHRNIYHGQGSNQYSDFHISYDVPQHKNNQYQENYFQKAAKRQRPPHTKLTSSRHQQHQQSLFVKQNQY